MLTSETILQSRYRVVRQLGTGGMGAVYEAVDARLDTTVALKETLFTDERLRRQFEREARLLARLHHPALPRVSDHFSEADGQFLVMQFIAGEDLGAMMSHKRGPFPPDQVLTWADQLLDALDYLHTQDPQIIHRDIKPQNLKLTPRGQIILLDFGLAKGHPAELSRVTTAASIFGYTPNYAPLEQIQGLGTDPRSDLYSLGATIYHLITSIKPPDALTRAAALVNGQPDPLASANAGNNGVTAEVAAVLQKAMAQNREQRFPNAEAMRRALRESGHAATLANRSEAATVLFTPVASTAAPTEPAAKPETIPVRETTVVQTGARRPGKVPAWVLAVIAVAVLGLGAGGFYAYKKRNNGAAASPVSINSNSDSQRSPPSPANERVVSVEVNDNKSEAESSAPKTAKKAEQPKRSQAKKRSDVNGDEIEAQSDVDEVHRQALPVRPIAPRIDSERFPARSRTLRLRDGTIVRRFPDGSQLITAPDGSRVMVTPDGKRQVLYDGRRAPRKP